MRSRAGIGDTGEGPDTACEIEFGWLDGTDASADSDEAPVAQLPLAESGCQAVLNREGGVLQVWRERPRSRKASFGS
jgi:hypothetical protein